MAAILSDGFLELDDELEEAFVFGARGLALFVDRVAVRVGERQEFALVEFGVGRFQGLRRIEHYAVRNCEEVVKHMEKGNSIRTHTCCCRYIWNP